MHVCVYVYTVHEIWGNKLHFGGKRHLEFDTLTCTHIVHIIKHIH